MADKSKDQGTNEAAILNFLQNLEIMMISLQGPFWREQSEPSEAITVVKQLMDMLRTQAAMTTCYEEINISLERENQALRVQIQADIESFQLLQQNIGVVNVLEQLRRSLRHT